MGYRILRIYDVVGKKISIKPIKVDSNLEPIEGEIIEVLDRDKQGKWFKVAYVTNASSEQNFVMIKPKGDERLSRKNSILALVNACGEKTHFIDWGKVKLK